MKQFISIAIRKLYANKEVAALAIIVTAIACLVHAVVDFWQGEIADMVFHLVAPIVFWLALGALVKHVEDKGLDNI